MALSGHAGLLARRQLMTQSGHVEPRAKPYAQRKGDRAMLSGYHYPSLRGPERHNRNRVSLSG